MIFTFILQFICIHTVLSACTPTGICSYVELSLSGQTSQKSFSSDCLQTGDLRTIEYNTMNCAGVIINTTIIPSSKLSVPCGECSLYAIAEANLFPAANGGCTGTRMGTSVNVGSIGCQGEGKLDTCTADALYNIIYENDDCTGAIIKETVHYVGECILMLGFFTSIHTLRCYSASPTKTPTKSPTKALTKAPTTAATFIQTESQKDSENHKNKFWFIPVIITLSLCVILILCGALWITSKKKQKVYIDNEAENVNNELDEYDTIHPSDNVDDAMTVEGDPDMRDRRGTNQLAEGYGINNEREENDVAFKTKVASPPLMIVKRESTESDDSDNMYIKEDKNHNDSNKLVTNDHRDIDTAQDHSSQNKQKEDTRGAGDIYYDKCLDDVFEKERKIDNT